MSEMKNLKVVELRNRVFSSVFSVRVAIKEDVFLHTLNGRVLQDNLIVLELGVEDAPGLGYQTPSSPVLWVG